MGDTTGLQICPTPNLAKLRTFSIVQRLSNQSGSGLNGVLVNKDLAYEPGSGKKWTSRSFKTSMESFCVLELQKRTHQDVAILVSFTDRPSMPAQIIVEHSSLPDADFQKCSNFEISSKLVLQANQGKLHEVCLVLKLGAHMPVQRYVRLRLVGHQPTNARPQTPRGGAGSSRAHCVQALLVTTQTALDQLNRASQHPPQGRRASMVLRSQESLPSTVSASNVPHRCPPRPSSALSARPARKSTAGMPARENLDGGDASKIAALHTPRSLRSSSSSTDAGNVLASQFSSLSLKLPLPTSKLPLDTSSKALSSRTRSGRQDPQASVKRPSSAGKPPERANHEAARRYSMLPLPRMPKLPEAPLGPSPGGRVTRARAKHASQTKAPALPFLARTEAQLDALTSDHSRSVAHTNLTPAGAQTTKAVRSLPVTQIQGARQQGVTPHQTTNASVSMCSPSLQDLQAQIDATARETEMLLNRPSRKQASTPQVNNQELQALLSSSAALAAKSGASQLVLQPPSPLEQMRETQKQMQEVVSRLESRQSSRKSSRASSRRVSCVGGISRKPPDLSVAVGKVLKASREARPSRQSLAAWPMGLVQHAWDTFQAPATSSQAAEAEESVQGRPSEDHGRTLTPDKRLSASVIRLRQHQAAMHHAPAAQPRVPLTENCNGTSPRHVSHKHGNADEQENFPAPANDRAMDSAESTKTFQNSTRSEMTTNPLWESFEGFKPRNSSQKTPPNSSQKTPPMTKQRSPQKSSGHNFRGMQAIMESPSTPEFHSPAQFSPQTVISPHVKAAESRRLVLDEDTPEHLALPPLPHTPVPSCSNATPEHLQADEKKSRKEKSQKKAPSIFSRILQASGLHGFGSKPHAEEEALAAMGLTGDLCRLSPDLRKGSFSKRRRKPAAKKEAVEHGMATRTRSMQARRAAQS